MTVKNSIDSRRMWNRAGRFLASLLLCSLIIALIISAFISVVAIGLADSCGVRDRDYSFGEWGPCPDDIRRDATSECRRGEVNAILVRFEIIQAREQIGDFEHYRGARVYTNMQWWPVIVLVLLTTLLLDRAK